MNDPMLEMHPSTVEEQVQAGDKLARTHAHAMAAMSFTLSWQSENARHVDCLVASRRRLRRSESPKSTTTS
jgi:hypothetical protein